MKGILVTVGAVACTVGLSSCVAQPPFLSNAEYCATIEQLASELDAAVSDTITGDLTLDQGIEGISAIAIKFIGLQPKNADLQQAHLAVADVLGVFARVQESPGEISLLELTQILTGAQRGTSKIIKVCQSLNKEVA